MTNDDGKDDLREEYFRVVRKLLDVLRAIRTARAKGDLAEKLALEAEHDRLADLRYELWKKIWKNHER